MIDGNYFPMQGDHIHIIAGCIMFAIATFGFIISLRIKRSKLFKFKVVIVYCIPLIMSVAYMVPTAYISHEYRVLLVCTFIGLMQILYWREVKELTSSISYNKQSLPDFLNLSPDMIWMKDLNNKFTYTNEALREGLLKCTEEEAFGKTGIELAEIQRKKGHHYTFGDICNDSDDMTVLRNTPCRFLEFGDINGKFLALQVFKAPTYCTTPEGKRVLQGTIGIGRDLTYDFLDHEKIKKQIDDGDIEGAIETFEMHRNRYMFTGVALLNTNNRRVRKTPRRDEDRKLDPEVRSCSLSNCS